MAAMVEARPRTLARSRTCSRGTAPARPRREKQQEAPKQQRLVRSSARPARCVRPKALGAEAPPLGTTLVLLGTPVGLAAYWWLVLVPSERRSLAKSKRKGALNTYLEELETDESRGLERWFYTDYLQKRQEKKKKKRTGKDSLEREGNNPPGQTVGVSAAALEDDGEVKTEEELEREADQAAAADPVFLSLDNPLVLTSLLLATFAILSLALDAFNTR